MKEILEKIYDKEIKSIKYDQYISVSIEQEYDDNYISGTRTDAEEPCYIIYFEDGSTNTLSISELIIKIFSLKDKL